MNKKKVLIIAPHADDEVLGCGGFINKNKKKYDINVLILTNANKGNPKQFSEKKISEIRKECLVSSKVLGIKKVSFENFPAPNLDQFPVSLIAETIKNYVNKFKPKMVFIPDKTDLHIDHKVIFHASMVALRPIQKHQVKYIMSYETLSETEWEDEQFNPNFFVSLSDNDVMQKIKAFKKYKSQNMSSNHPRSSNGILNLAKYRGQFINSKYAEAFKLIRGINR